MRHLAGTRTDRFSPLPAPSSTRRIRTSTMSPLSAPISLSTEVQANPSEFPIALTFILLHCSPSFFSGAVPLSRDGSYLVPGSYLSMTNIIVSEENPNCLFIRIYMPSEFEPCSVNLLIDMERPRISRFRRSIDQYLVARNNRRRKERRGQHP